MSPGAWAVWRKPAVGGTGRSNGGHFVFLSGRPYRYGANHLRTNVEYILENFFHEPSTSQSEEVILSQNFPNPFHTTTRINYRLPVSGRVRLEVYNILGQKIETLIDEHQSAHYNEKVRNISYQNPPLSSGIYFLRLTLGGDNQSNYEKSVKILVVK